MIAPQRLRALRNRVPIESALRELGIVTKRSEGRLRFLCPLCGEFDTGTNPRTNLARCFRCHRNFNPIDLAMVAERLSFLDAVKLIEALLASE